MSLVSNPIDALFNGVSQQPAAMRLPSQCEDQVNGYSSVANGLSKRAPSEYLAKLDSAAWGDAFIHIINRDTTERYAVVITDEVLKVYDLLDGSAETVTFENSDAWAATTAYALDDLVRPTSANGALFRCTTAGTSGGSEPTWDSDIGDTTADASVVWTAIDNYLAIPAGAKASESFELVTVADYTFLVNKTKTVATRSTGTAQHGRYSNWYFPDNWTHSGDDTRYYVPVAGTDKGSVQTLADLPKAGDPSPPSASDFYTIAGNDAGDFSKYYVIYQSGVWQETHDRNSSITLDEASMPHALVRESDFNFHFREFGWVPRLFGDNDTNPLPSFVGKKINDLGYHKNRLVIAAGENNVFSGAGDYGNFFRNTVVQLLDSDVVDVAVSTKSVAIVNHILPADNALMFFSDQTQFVLNVDQLLTPGTVSIDVATSYEMNKKVKPISIGQDVYFVSETGDFSRVREYGLGNGDTIGTDATDVTAHVGKYLPKNVFRLAGSSNEDLLLALSSESGFRNRLYAYKFFYSGSDKVQSAWGYWEFASGDVILDVSILNNIVYLVVERSDGVFLETMNVQNTDYPLALDFNILLDRRYNFAGGDKAFDSTYTTFTLPYEIAAGEQAAFRLVEADGATKGRLLDTSLITFPTANTVKIIGDYTGIEIIGGLNYTHSYTFSEQFHRRSDGQAITIGRYQLRTFTIVFEDTAFFKTVVDPYGTVTQEQTEDIVTQGLATHTAKTLGEANLILGTPVFSDGTYSFQIYGESKVSVVKIVNDQPFNSTIVSATVEGFYTKRGR